ncbi:DUF6783 domain-containing protein, partial [Blautia faecicola]
GLQIAEMIFQTRSRTYWIYFSYHSGKSQLNFLKYLS